jgi:hypothetical protein
VRQRYGLPEIDDATRAQIRCGADRPGRHRRRRHPPCRGHRRHFPDAGRRGRGRVGPADRHPPPRPTPIEAAAKTDFQQHQHDWQDALDVLVASWASITRAQRQQLVDQVKAAVTSGSGSTRSPTCPSTPAAAAKLAAR